MRGSPDPEQLFVKKAYEICYALARIASSVKSEGFARRLEENGFLLLEAVASGEFKKIGRIGAVVEYLLRLGSDIGFVHPANTETISRELSHLNSAIAECGNSAKAEEVPIENIFSKFSFPAPESEKYEDIFEKFEKREEIFKNRNNNGNEYKEGEQKYSSLENGNGQRNIAKAAIRQSMILERIRQMESLPDRQAGCRMKEIQEVLPDVSERTLRYDLQGLMERGAIERIGNGGPATSYKVKEASPSG